MNRKKQPNLIFIFSDQQHHRAMGAKDPFFKTPNLDGFAATATRFDKVYCATPLCSPARATLMTGRSPWKHGVVDNGIPLREETIAQRLQRQGYYTAYFGKWHLGEDPAAIAGWDEKQGVYNEYKPPNRPLSDREVCDYALEFISRADEIDKPVALFISLDEPHGVYWAMPNSPYSKDFMNEPVVPENTPLPASWAERELPDGPPWDTYPMGNQKIYSETVRNSEAEAKRYRAVYRDCLTRFDRNLGELLDKLKQKQIFDDALVMITTDHGDMDAAHRLIFKGPVPFEELHRIPLAVKLPNQKTGRVETNALVSTADLPATLLDYAGKPQATEDGFSLRAVLEGTGLHEREEAIIQYPKPLIRSIRRGKWKYSRFPNGVEWLFDVEADPSEMKNLAADSEMKPVMKDLSRRIDAAVGR
ncbi:MAG: sulfatase-like hydrolase/transferase [Kiritimatiellaceae bacterium]|nr:sulfatase-like hydrolase/transferase [Kiritimatiellaceae bacterium]